MTRFSSFASFVVASLLSVQSCAGFSNNTGNTNTNRIRFGPSDVPEGGGGGAMGRRDLLDNVLRRFPIAVTAAVVITASLPLPPSQALDFDAFESNQISKDSSKPVLNDDEALCKYGAPGKAMGAACERAKMKPRLPGFVDAFGKVDRGDYLNCKYEYPVVNGAYVKTRVCKPSNDWAAS